PCVVPAAPREGSLELTSANRLPHPDPSAFEAEFSGKYSHRTIEGGRGYSLHQEAPEAFAQAIVDVDGAT
ncbi:MAG TPA: hypothetical protein VN880_01745, partial [Solirubrobacteraceae bacterium]|nr:hypothetical protein [Solirubrobacteraceae bacterium]